VFFPNRPLPICRGGLSPAAATQQPALIITNGGKQVKQFKLHNTHSLTRFSFTKKERVKNGEKKVIFFFN
jgi:hypothetical protein